ncbi:hypothetical protein EMN47_03750 [Prolixibacteraceae bacterium JC049]|nr:hypothetical protein [Prolixibacteraceae bacterium JC049]
MQMKFKRKYIGILILLFLWLLVFADHMPDSAVLGGIIATARVSIMAFGYFIFKHFYLKPNSPRRNLRLMTAFIVLGCIMGSTEVLSDVWLEPMFGVEHPEHSYHEEHEPFWLEVFFSMFMGSMLIGITMVVSWALLLYEKTKKDELAISQLETLKKEAELNELKNQLNPHFLFNALSNIYSIAYLGEKETPNKIMQLSKILRYVIYETDVEKIELMREIENINYYLEFQRFKLNELQPIEFNYADCNQALKVAPMLLLPFIENAFKHSQLAVEKNAWIKIDLRNDGNNLFYKIENTISVNKKPELLGIGGVGMENVKKRLELLYPDRYKLDINIEDRAEGPSVYCVLLEIDLS